MHLNHTQKSTFVKMFQLIFWKFFMWVPIRFTLEYSRNLTATRVSVLLYIFDLCVNIFFEYCLQVKVNDSLMQFNNLTSLQVDPAKTFTFVRVEWASSAYTNIDCIASESSNLSLRKNNGQEIYRAYSNYKVFYLNALFKFIKSVLYL